MDEESTENMVILPGITSSWTRNSKAEYFFAGNYKLMDEESTQGMVIPSGITSSWTLLQAGRIKMREKSYERE
jgi:hypothetical protein